MNNKRIKQTHKKVNTYKKKLNPYMKLNRRRDTTIETTTHQINPNKAAQDAKRTIKTTTFNKKERKKK